MSTFWADRILLSKSYRNELDGTHVEHYEYACGCWSEWATQPQFTGYLMKMDGEFCQQHKSELVSIHEEATNE